VIVFNRETKNFTKGEVGTLLKATPTHLLIEAENKISKIPFKRLDRLTVCRPAEIALAKASLLPASCSRSSNGLERPFPKWQIPVRFRAGAPLFPTKFQGQNLIPHLIPF
jgi:hypothetical protein